MKNLLKFLPFLFVIVLLSSLMTSCKKDKIEPTPKEKTPIQETTPQEVAPEITALLSMQPNEMNTTDSTNCDCFDWLEQINWDASDAEIMIQLEALLASLTDEEIELLLTPVYGQDGELYLNQCEADCLGIVLTEPNGGDDADWNECFSFIYPLTIIFPDGSLVPVNNDEALIEAVDDWGDANPNVSEDPTLEYPVSVLLQSDSSMVTLNNDEELEELFDSCEEGHEEACLEFVFPLEIMFPDSSTASVESYEHAEAFVEAWYDAHPDVMEDVELIFPLQVIFAGGSPQTVQNEEELEELIEACDGDIGGCFFTSNTSTAFRQVVGTKKKAVKNK